MDLSFKMFKSSKNYTLVSGSVRPKRVPPNLESVSHDLATNNCILFPFDIFRYVVLKSHQGCKLGGKVRPHISLLSSRSPHPPTTGHMLDNYFSYGPFTKTVQR